MAYAIQRIFFGLDEDTLEAIRDKAISLITEGKTVTSWSVAGNNFNKQFAMPPAEALAEAQAALRDLSGDRVTRIYPDFRNTFWSGQ